MNSRVNVFISKTDKWREEFELLREIALNFPLIEELKWGCPCYSFDNGKIILIHGFKEYCALLFFKGVLLSDENQVLIQQTEHVQSARQIRFRSVAEIHEMRATLEAYISEAIEVEKSDLQVELKKSADFKIPEEFASKLAEVPALQKAFYALTPGRQRGYLLHFSGAKQSKTRTDRVERSMPQILQGKGLLD